MTLPKRKYYKISEIMEEWRVHKVSESDLQYYANERELKLAVNVKNCRVVALSSELSQKGKLYVANGSCSVSGLFRFDQSLLPNILDGDPTVIQSLYPFCAISIADWTLGLPFDTTRKTEPRFFWKTKLQSECEDSIVIYQILLAGNQQHLDFGYSDLRITFEDAKQFEQKYLKSRQPASPRKQERRVQALQELLSIWIPFEITNEQFWKVLNSRDSKLFPSPIGNKTIKDFFEDQDLWKSKASLAQLKPTNKTTTSFSNK
jgi:hypothetical protein